MPVAINHSATIREVALVNAIGSTKNKIDEEKYFILSLTEIEALWHKQNVGLLLSLGELQESGSDLEYDNFRRILNVFFSSIIKKSELESKRIFTFAEGLALPQIEINDTNVRVETLRKKVELYLSIPSVYADLVSLCKTLVAQMLYVDKSKMNNKTAQISYIQIKARNSNNFKINPTLIGSETWILDCSISSKISNEKVWWENITSDSASDLFATIRFTAPVPGSYDFRITLKIANDHFVIGGGEFDSLIYL